MNPISPGQSHRNHPTFLGGLQALCQNLHIIGQCVNFVLKQLVLFAANRHRDVRHWHVARHGGVLRTSWCECRRNDGGYLVSSWNNQQFSTLEGHSVKCIPPYLCAYYGVRGQSLSVKNTLTHSLTHSQTYSTLYINTGIYFLEKSITANWDTKSTEYNKNWISNRYSKCFQLMMFTITFLFIKML